MSKLWFGWHLGFSNSLGVPAAHPCCRRVLLGSLSLGALHLPSAALQPPHALHLTLHVAVQRWWLLLFFSVLCATQVIAADAAITGMTSPVRPFTSGLQSIAYTLKNNGTQPLTSAQIKWGVANQGFNTYSWNGNLGVGQSTTITVGNFMFLSNIAYEWKAFVTTANGQPDSNNANDTLAFASFAAALPSGVYTIGGSNPSFPSINVAMALLNGGGIFGPVTYLLRDGTYNEQIYLADFPGNGPASPVVIRSESNNAQNVLIQFADYYVVNIEGTEHITIKHLTLKNNNTDATDLSNANGIHLKGSNQHISIEHCVIEGVAPYSIGNGIWIEQGGDNLLVEDCTFRHFAYGIRFNEWDNNISQSPEVNGCNFLTAGRYGIYAASVNNLTIRDCELNAKEYQPLSLLNCSGNLTVSGNSILQQNNACMYIRAVAGLSEQAVISNNFLYNEGGTGMVISNCLGLKLYYNTIRAHNTTSTEYALQVDSSSNIVGRNNIFFVSGSGASLWTNAAYNFDYNDYYAAGGFKAFLGQTAYTGLPQWQVATSGNSHSVSVNPDFNGSSFHTSAALLDGSGLVLPNITDDIEGDPRDPLTPDIGADEFSATAPIGDIDMEVLSVSSTASACQLSSAYPITATVKNNSDIAVTGFTMSYTLNGNTVSSTYAGVAIAAGASFVYAFSETADLSADGSYSLSVSVFADGDGNMANNSKGINFENLPSPIAQIVATPNTAICPGMQVTFTASGGGSYAWNTGQQGATLTVAPMTPATYTVTVTATNGCTSTKSRSVVVSNGIVWFLDADGDGYGGEITEVSCTLPDGYSSIDGDCDDSNQMISPVAPDICNGLDDDCDGILDNGSYTCPPPTNLITPLVNENDAFIKWQPVACAHQYRLIWRETALTAAWATADMTTDTVTLLSLEADTEYEARVRAICSNGDLSAHSSLLIFKTGKEGTGIKVMKIVPNPAHDYILVRAQNLPDGECHIRLFDLYGKEVFYKTATVSQGMLESDMMLYDIPSGLYSVQVQLSNYKLLVATCFKE